MYVILAPSLKRSISAANQTHSNNAFIVILFLTLQVVRRLLPRWQPRYVERHQALSIRHQIVTY